MSTISSRTPAAASERRLRASVALWTDYDLPTVSQLGSWARRHAGQILAALFAVCLGVATTLYVQGYEFGRSNQTLYLLDALRHLSPELFRNDWLLTHTTQYHFTFAVLTRWLMRLNILEPAFLSGYIVLVVLLHVAWFGLVRKLGGSHVTYLFSVLFFYASNGGVAPGDCDFLQDHAFLPSNIANIAMLWGILMWVSGRIGWSAVCFGLAGMSHLNHALAVVPLWGALAAWRWYRPGFGADAEELAVTRGKHEFTRYVIGGITIMLLSLPSVLSVLLRLRAQQHPLPLPEYVDLFVRLRAPHHFEPLTWSAGVWLNFLWPIPLAYMAARRAAPTFARRETSRIFLIICGAMLISLLGAGIWYVSELLINLSFYRFSIFPKLLSCIGAAYLVGGWLIRRLTTTRGSVYVCAAATVVLALVAANSLGVLSLSALEHAGRDVRMLLFLTASSLVCACLCGAPFARMRLPLYALATAALLVQVSISCYRWLGVSNITAREADYLALCDWARDRSHTPVDAVFLVPPDEQAFRLRAQRAIVVNFKGVPPLASEMAEWRDRLRSVLAIEDLRTLPRGLDSAPSAMSVRYDSLPPDYLVKIARRYSARYVVLSRDTRTPPSQHLVFENDSYRLYDLSM